MSRAVVSQGRYRAAITDWGLGESREKKTPHVFFTFDLLYEIGSDGPIKCPSFSRTIYRYITPDTIDFVSRDLAGLGYDREGFDYLDPQHPQAFNFKGKQIDVQCKHEEYKGEDKERWDFAFNATKSDPLAKDGVSRLNALFADKLKAARGAAALPPERQSYAADQRAQTQHEAEEVF